MLNISPQWSQPALSVFQSFFPAPPVQGAVGRPPAEYLAILRREFGHPIGCSPVESLYPCVTSKCDRNQVRTICRDSRVDVLEAYAVAMAWGGQHRRWFRTSLASPTLVGLLTEFRFGSGLRDQDFSMTQAVSKDITGLGISYFTKLLYFFRPQGNAYILDQWTAKSMQALRTGVLRLDGDMPARDTSSAEYVMFCEMCERLTREFPGWAPEQIEQALFDGKGGKWRAWVKRWFQGMLQSDEPSKTATGAGGGQEPPFDKEEPDEPEGDDGDERDALLTAIEKTHKQHAEAGMPLPGGILNRRSSDVWPGGSGLRVSEIKWFYRVKKRPMSIEIGVLFAPQLHETRSALIAANPNGRWFGSALAEASGNTISIQLPRTLGTPPADLSEWSVSTMSLLYSLVKKIARTGGIYHPQL